MKKTILLLLLVFFSENLKAKDEIYIIASIDKFIITNKDLENEIKLSQILGADINSKNFEKITLDNLINYIIKKIEVDKNLIKLNEDQIQKNYEKFINSNILYINANEKLKKLIYNKIEVEEKWNYLIFQKFQWKINVNIEEINDRIKNSNNLNSKEITLLKEKFLNEERNKKFNLYSRNFLEELKQIYLIKIFK